MRALVVVWAMQGWFGVLLVVSDGVTIFPRPRRTEQRCCLEMAFFSVMIQLSLWNRCVDGHTVVLCWFVLFFSFENLMLSLVSQDLDEFVSLLSHLWISVTATWLLHIPPSPACLSSHSWWHPGSFWPWCPDSPSVAQTTQLAVLTAGSLC